MIANAVLTDDDRFLLIYNFNPSQSVTVVDTKTRQFVGEMESPGCALVYPTGPRSFFTVCGDGSLLLVDLDEHGRRAAEATEPLLEHGRGPGDGEGRADRARPGTSSRSTGASFRSRWMKSMRPSVHLVAVSEAERKAGWRPGGLQQLAVNVRQFAPVCHHASRRHRDAQGSGQGRVGIRCGDSAAGAANHAQESGGIDPALER